MPDATTCAVVIPCFNESRTIASLVTALRRQFPWVLVVDDGSTDGTAAKARTAGAKVVAHSKNFGKGAALKTGLAYAFEAGFQWALTLDGDGQHSPADAPAFLDCASRTGARLVVGNRMHNAQAMPWVRRFVNRWMSRRLSRRSDQPLPDSQCGYRLIHLESWSALRLQTNHFEVESEILLAFLGAGARVTFVPVQVLPSGRPSHIRPFVDSLRWCRWWLDRPRFADGSKCSFHAGSKISDVRKTPSKGVTSRVL